MNPTTRLRGAALLAGLTLSSPALAEEGSAADAGAPTPAPSAPASPAASSVDARLARQEAQIEDLSARDAVREKQLAALRREASAAKDEAPTKLLSFWGFSDLTFGGVHYDSPNALYKVATPYAATFYSGGINLYAKSVMTRTLSALVETQLTYTPNGAIPGGDYAGTAYVGSTQVASDPGSTPANTTVHAPYSQLLYRQDGLVIERAYLEWKPADWFALRIGRFLTPFGIWNEDHGSPVLIGIDYPQFMNFNLVPLQQLGLEAYGSVPLTDDLRAEYAVTFANSNGPSDEYKDLTDMKALGARLKLVYSHDDLYVRLGAYGYYNHYENSSDSIAIHLTPNLTVAPQNGVQDVTAVTEAYDEVIVTGDLDVRFKKLRLLAEFANQTVLYDQPSTFSLTGQLIKGIPANVTAYDVNHYGYGGYVMAAYEIPFHTKLLDFTVTPYVGGDYVVPSTSVTANQTKQVRGGLNVKPSPFVTVKVEVSRVIPEAALLDSQGTAVFGQVAYSF